MEKDCCCEGCIEELAAEILIARLSVPGLGIHPPIEKVCEEYEALFRTIDRLVREKSSESCSEKSD
jgi:hypothetical protein